MKRLMLIPTLLLLIWGCTKDNLKDNTKFADIKQSTPISLTIDSVALTRGTPVEDEAALGTVGMYCAYTAKKDWNSTTTEFNKMNNAQFNYNAETLLWDYSANNSEDQPTWGHTSITDKYTFYAYSPYSTEATGITPEIESGALKINYTVPESFDDQVDLMVATPRKNIYPQMGGNVNMSFNHALAKVSFSVKGDPTLKVKSITLKDLKNSGTLTFNANNDFLWSSNSTTDSYTVSQYSGLKSNVTTDEETVNNITTENGYLFMIPQDASGKSVEIVIVDADGNEIDSDPLTIPDNQVWAAGGAYNYEITVKESIVLSFHETYPDVATCYIISPTTTSEITIPINEYISYFWKYYGANEEKAYANLKSEDLEAAVIWHDNTNMYPISSLSVANISKGKTTKSNPNVSYPNFAASTSTMAIKVKIKKNSTSNVVIGVKKKWSKDYLWSWHLWITDYNPYTKKNGTTYTINSDGKGTMLTWMDRNLGARDINYHSEDDGALGVLLYQWGRKDPIPAIISDPYVKNAGYFANDIATAVKNPAMFYSATSAGAASNNDYDWCGGSKQDWDHDRAYHWRDNKLQTINEKDSKYDPNNKFGNKKSIFDPSPLGFIIPGSTSTDTYTSPFSFLSLETVTYDKKTNKGITYKGSGTPIFFPLTGERAYGGGSYLYNNTYGHYWSASPASVYSGYDFYFMLFDRLYKVNSSANYRTSAYAIRPVKE